MKRTYKYRIYPSKSQTGKLINTFSMCRHLYNWSLAERITAYEVRKYSNFVEKNLNSSKKRSIYSTCSGQLLYTKKTESAAVNTLISVEGIFGIMFSSVWERIPRIVNYNYQANKLSELKKKKPWYKSPYSQVLQATLVRLDKSYDNFYRRVKEGKEKAGFPKYKKRGQWNSITYPQHKKSPEEGKIKVPKIGDIKIIYHRKLPEVSFVKTLSIKKDGDKWFVCFSVDIPLKDREPKQGLSKSIGIDLGLIDFYYGSDGSQVPVPKYFRKNEKRLKKLQRKFQKVRDENKNKEKPEKYYKLLKALQKVHYRIRSQREDFIHKKVNRLLREFDIIIHENLNIKNMSRRPKPKQDVNGKYLPNRTSIKAGLNKSINDVGWYKFTQILKYKALTMGKTVISIDPKKTSQICSGCGNRVEKTLSERTHLCSECGLILPRDYNSALYIKRLGLESLGNDSCLRSPYYSHQV